MMNRMKQAKFARVLTTLVLLAFATKAISGNLDAPADPNDPNSAMYTLEDAYNRLATGAAGTKRTGGFKGPTSAPDQPEGIPLMTSWMRCLFRTIQMEHCPNMS